MSVPYNMKNLEVIRRVAKKRKRKLVAHRASTLFNLLRNDTDPLQQEERRGIYRIPVQDMQMKSEMGI